MRSLIIIIVVVITFIAVHLIVPMRKDIQAEPADTTVLQAAVQDSAGIHAYRQQGKIDTPQADTARALDSGVGRVHTKHSSQSHSISHGSF